MLIRFLFFLFICFKCFSFDFNISTGFGIKYNYRYDYSFEKIEKEISFYDYRASKIGMDFFVDFNYVVLYVSYNFAINADRIIIQDGIVAEKKNSYVLFADFLKRDSLDIKTVFKYPIHYGAILVFNPEIFINTSFYLNSKSKKTYEDSWQNYNDQEVKKKINLAFGLGFSFDIFLSKIVYIRPYFHYSLSIFPEINQYKGAFMNIEGGIYLGFKFYSKKIKSKNNNGSKINIDDSIDSIDNI